MQEMGHIEKQRRLQKGALLIGEAKSDKQQDIQNEKFRTIEFQFNPESLKRTLKIVTPQERPGGRRRGENRQADPRDLKTDSHVGESISITARFDGKVGYGTKRTGKEYEGENQKWLREDTLPYLDNSNLLPVLSAIERIMEPIDTDLKKTAKGHKNPPKVLPLVFFWWGEYRILPVKITQMTINETEFDPELSPVRAEVNLEMEVLVPGSKSDKRIKDSYKYVQNEKKKQAKKYFGDPGVDQSLRTGFEKAVPGAVAGND
jgi:Contractile injection system tube protein